MNFILRRFDSADFSALYDIDQACYPPGIAYSRRMLRDFLRQASAECVVAQSAGRIAGFIISDLCGAMGHIITLDVLEEFRRRGIGSALLAAAEQSLAARGARRVELETATDNELAIAFWHKHGYRTRAVIPHYYAGGADAFYMTRALRRET